ncbi:MAG: lamin tail domain-containing protein [Methanotrichaceae archaeon]|nr:lamin tail domain-containing protein [Methanotrichaceae archaeon]
MKTLLKVLLAVFLVASSGAPALGSIVINEVELNSPGDEDFTRTYAWIELYNSGSASLDISGWKIVSSENATAVIPDGTVIPAIGYYGLTKTLDWLPHENVVLVLVSPNGTEVDRTPALSDTEDNELSWTRDPDGRDTDSIDDWKFLVSSNGF